MLMFLSLIKFLINDFLYAFQLNSEQEVMTVGAGAGSQDSLQQMVCVTL